VGLDSTMRLASRKLVIQDSNDANQQCPDLLVRFMTRTIKDGGYQFRATFARGADWDHSTRLSSEGFPMRLIESSTGAVVIGEDQGNGDVCFQRLGYGKNLRLRFSGRRFSNVKFSPPFSRRTSERSASSCRRCIGVARSLLLS